MSKLINQYPITFPYGATSAPYSISHPHRGSDLPLNYEPVIIGTTQIGISGATGQVDGPHCHVQAGSDVWAQNTINSADYIGQPGTVVKTGYASQWGNYVCVLVNSVYVYYCHLSRIDVTVGQIIHGEDNVAIVQNADNWRNRLNKVMQRERGRDLNEVEFQQWVGQDFIRYVEAVEDNPEADAWYNLATLGRTATTNNWQQQITDLTNRTNDMQNTINTLQNDLGTARAQVVELTPKPVEVVPIQNHDEATIAPTTEPVKTSETSRTGLVVKLLAGLLAIRKKRK